jgi:hypothetical protein
LKDFTGDIANLNGLIQQLTVRVADIERANFIDVVRLSMAQPNLIGRYRASAEHIIITLDATNGAFTVSLPSAKEVQDKIFIIKKVDEVATAVTLQAKPGEYIHDSGAAAASLVITGAAPVNMVSDRVSTWLVAG